MGCGASGANKVQDSHVTTTGTTDAQYDTLNTNGKGGGNGNHDRRVSEINPRLLVLGDEEVEDILDTDEGDIQSKDGLMVVKSNKDKYQDEVKSTSSSSGLQTNQKVRKRGWSIAPDDTPRKPHRPPGRRPTLDTIQ